MKTLILLIALCTSGLLLETTFAQITFSVNLTSQPIWGPVGYDHVEYYYLPDIDAYYYVPGQRYIYMENGNWRSRSNLPSRYRGYDMYNTRKVVINEDRPYLRHNDYRSRYASSNDRYQSIRDSRESKYYGNRNHPEHSKWKQDQKIQKQHQKQDQRNQKRQQKQEKRGGHNR